MIHDGVAFAANSGWWLAGTLLLLLVGAYYSYFYVRETTATAILCLVAISFALNWAGVYP